MNDAELPRKIAVAIGIMFVPRRPSTLPPEFLHWHSSRSSVAGETDLEMFLQ